MGNKFFRRIISFVLFGSIMLSQSVGDAENIITGDDDSRRAYGENVGWANFEPTQGAGVTVSDTTLTGYVWAENIGWINLSPTSFGGVTNDVNGNLSGYAWGENVGWINFDPTGSGVKIDSDGDFNGYAWGENIGWIHFSGTAQDGTKYKVMTTWLGADNKVGDPIGSSGSGGCFISTAGDIPDYPE